MNRPIEWFHRHPFTTALVVLLIVVVPGYARLEQVVHESAKHTEALAAEARRSDHVACTNRRDTIIVVRRLVELTRSDGSGLNLTGVSGFEDLSPEMKTYLRNLEALSQQAPDPDGFVSQALQLLVVPVCS